MTTNFRQRLVKNSDFNKFDKLFVDVLAVLMRATAAITVFSLKRRDDREWGAHLVKTAMGSFVIEPTGGTIGDEYRLSSVKRNIKQRDTLINKIINPKLFRIKEDVFTMAGYTITVVGPDLPGQKTRQKAKAKKIEFEVVELWYNDISRPYTLVPESKDSIRNYAIKIGDNFFLLGDSNNAVFVCDYVTEKDVENE